MFTYVIESEKDLKEIACGMPVKCLVELSMNIKKIVKVKNKNCEDESSVLSELLKEV